MEREPPPSALPTGLWAAGDRYEAYIGRWSRKVAQEFLAWLSVPPGKDWLDLGCGTGALTRAVLRLAAPRRVVGIDFSPAFLAQARQDLEGAPVALSRADAQDLPLHAASFDTAVSGLTLNFVPDPQKAANEMARSVRPGGLAAVYVWDYGGQMQFLRYFWDAVTELDPPAAFHDEGRFPLCRPQTLTAVFQAAGLTRVETRPIDIPTRFRDFDDFWTPFLNGPGPAPRYVMALPEEQRSRLREMLRSRLPAAPDGTIPLIARAWAVRGIRTNPPPT